MLTAFQIIALLGVALSFYALKVERKMSREKSYKAACDINDHVSCTKAFSSSYGHVFGVPNSLLGLGFYLFVFVMSFTVYKAYIIYFAAFSLLFSVYLAYLSYVKMKNYCLVCNGIYLINILLLVLSWP